MLECERILRRRKWKGTEANMEVLYNSTRSKQSPVKASEAILKGLSKDGGLFVPDKIPAFDKTWEELAEMTYGQVAYEVMKLYLTDFTEEELKGCIARDRKSVV